MSCLNKFVKRNFLWILLALLLAGSHLLYLYLLPASVEDIGYAALLDACLLGLLFFLAWMEYIRRVKKFQKLLALPIPDQIKVPEPVDDIEQLYGQILENVAIQQRLLEDQTQLQQTEMYDYYARWVHQIKTPITALQLLLETQKKDVAKDAEMILEKAGKENAVLENLLEQQYTQNMEQFSDMEEELFCIEQYVGMALQYQRVKSESKDYVFTQVSVDKMVRTVIRKFAKLMIRKKIPMQYEGCRQQVITDEKWCAFVLEQVLSNAIKYTKHGTIRIRIEQEPNWLYIVIEDQGIGIRKEDIPRVFEKGYSGYNGHEDKRSTGIGLYLSRQILEKLGHTIRIESEVGKGTAVWIGFSMKQINVQD